MKELKPLLKNAYLSYHGLEIIFSSLRWVFLLLSTVVFTVRYTQNPDPLKFYLFVALVVFGILYMGVSDYYLHKSPEGSTMYTFMTKGGPFFDFIAFSALIPLTGGIESPLLPVAYLILLHIAVYWRIVGGLIAATLFCTFYSIIFYMQVSDVYTLSNLVVYFCHVLFLYLVGGLGGIIVSRERKQHSEKNELAEVANRDYLTNLLNHRSFQENLRKDLENGSDFYLVLADIDRFKSINDQHGHVTGDKVLRQIGEIISTIIPAKQGKVFRYGGEEFAIILHMNRKKEVDNLLVTIKEAIASHLFYCDGGESFSVTMSFGSCIQNGEKPDQLVEKVDKLLYEAKHRGRNQIVYSNVG
ncbi:GGDEF domain-containing protein [Bacillus sp. FJAT-45066]|uniref:GGDEF domain-containing protein n=1 Tax=Bacillus sp. FJAT-45066 TaxID=2011010 RepID=UPI0020D14BAA|nr:GGDEF domain-containing protein [Bacillus sp. FJAT-45066]